MKKKVILAFSGGLDTTFCAIWLRTVKDCEVHAVTINTGGFNDNDIARLEQHARNLGVASFTAINAKNEYYQQYIRFLVYGNILKNNTYPLSVSAERLVQARMLAKAARKANAEAIAHGSTGAGNDQVRFDMVFQILLPDTEIITPIRDLRLSREEEITFLKAHGVQMDFEKAAYSINQGLWGTSVGGKETLTSHGTLPEHAYPTQASATEPRHITLHFTRGELTGVDEQRFENPVQAIQYLQEISGPYGIGRDIHVGDTIIGIKGRVGFEAAAPIIIIKAHHALEKHVLTKWQLYWKDQVALWYGNWMHEGQVLDPVMRDLEAMMESTQQKVNGEVYVTLYPYRLQVTGISSPHDLMSSQFGAYGEMNNAWTGDDVKGFTRIFGNPTFIYHQVNGLENVWQD